jgi:hypothetical protein
MKSEIYFEFSGKQVLTSELEKQVKEIWKTAGKTVKDINNYKLYVNSGESKCYYKINDDFEGSFEL